MALGTILRNYLAEHSPGSIASLWLEQWLGALVRSFPGPEGVALRNLVYKLLFGQLGPSAIIFPGAYLDHCRNIRAGRSLSINAGAYVSGRGGLTIGDQVLIGPNAVVVTTHHRWDDPDRPIQDQGHRLLPTRIGSDVWIGANAVVLPGVAVGTGTVVSAGAVVTRDTEPYSIVVGAPARSIGDRRQRRALAEKEA